MEAEATAPCASRSRRRAARPARAPSAGAPRASAPAPPTPRRAGRRGRGRRCATRAGAPRRASPQVTRAPVSRSRSRFSEIVRQAARSLSTNVTALGAARERLDPHRAGAGEEVEHAGAVDRPDQVERRLADAVAGRPGREPLRRGDPGAAMRAGDDSHAVALPHHGARLSGNRDRRDRDPPPLPARPSRAAGRARRRPPRLRRRRRLGRLHGAVLARGRARSVRRLRGRRGAGAPADPGRVRGGRARRHGAGDPRR